MDINDIKDIIKDAGEILKEGFYKENQIKTKTGITDLVTEYDLRVEEYLIERLKENYPEYNFLTEENNPDETNVYNTFIIDPIDGTTNFIHKFPYVSISLAVYTKGNPNIGIVYNPIMNEMYEGEIGKGAFCNGKEISVTKKDIKDTISCIQKSSRIQVTENDLETLNNLNKTCLGIRKINSAALEICYVAKGVFGFYAVNRISSWDVAAASIILSEAGGRCFDFFNKDIDLLNLTTYIGTSK